MLGYMDKLIVSLLIAAATSVAAPQTLRGILLEQLKTTHNQKDWFVPVSVAVEGLTAEQAKWTDGSGNHSVGQLAEHLVFWNERVLAEFQGRKPAAYSGKNDETFNSFDAKSWDDTVRRLEAVLTAWEKAVEGTGEKKLRKQASTIAHVGAHNAYHTGQMVFVRKLQGSWNPEKGVK